MDHNGAWTELMRESDGLDNGANHGTCPTPHPFIYVGDHLATRHNNHKFAKGQFPKSESQNLVEPITDVYFPNVFDTFK